MFVNHMTALAQNQNQVKLEVDAKRKATEPKPRSRKKAKSTARTSGEKDEDDWFAATTSENSFSRLNWQKGRQDWARPSRIKAEIDKVTVDTLPEIYPIMRKHRWAILRDCKEALSPKARFTQEQRDHILKCM